MKLVCLVATVWEGCLPEICCFWGRVVLDLNLITTSVNAF